MKNFAVTQYTNYSFNSVCKVGDKYYGANSSGIFLLEGDNDSGADIDGKIMSGVEDLRNSRMKIVHRGGANYRSNGQVKLRTVSLTSNEATPWTDRRVERRYPIVGRTRKMSPGVRSDKWQFGIMNEGGSSFEINRLNFEVETMGRDVK